MLNVRCVICGLSLQVSGERLDAFVCLNCGGLEARLDVFMHDIASTKEQIRIKAKDPLRRSKEKERYRAEFGDDFCYDTGKWNKRVFIVDEDSKRISEKIINPENNQVIREYDEPLSNHFGRGSAKSNKN